MKPVVSICVPVYNGEEYLPAFLDSLISQYREGVEIVLCDDVSKDRTPEIAKQYAEKYPYIHFHRNEKNLGMDANFTRAARLGEGEYVWLSGQDDIFNPGSLDKFFEILKSHPETNFFYFNYRLLDGNLQKEIAPPALNEPSDHYFPTAADYFKVLKYPPSFLPATVYRRRYWHDTKVENFFQTYYVQVGVWLSHMHEGKIYVVADPKYIVCRNPADSWKFSSGQMLFGIYCGELEVYSKCFYSKKNVMPSGIFHEHFRNFDRNFLFRLIEFSQRGLKINDRIRKNLRVAYAHHSIVYFLKIKPLLAMPPAIFTLLYQLKKLAKRILRRT